MKALIRNKGEIVTQEMKVSGIKWDTGAPLTNRDWYGGPYTLVNDYVPEDSVGEFAPADDGATYGYTNPSVASHPADPAPAASQDPAVEEAAPDTIVIDGVTYTRTS